jgi:cellulose synthase/poly-beta-1,6-N-acetylglucosamine synthase-like glycosyltransferase
VFSVQDRDDPVIPLLREIEAEFGPERVTVAIETCRPGTNGKINNMTGGILHARHEILVISDSDVRLQPDYLKTIVAPLADPSVGCVCTLYKAACADRWFEKMELLTLNADFMSSVVFAHVSGASKFCLGASAALRRSTLEEIGGLEALADYLVEDYEMGRRIWTSGKKIVIVPYLIDTMVDLKTPAQWWNHQVYWDQNTRAARSPSCTRSRAAPTRSASQCSRRCSPCASSPRPSSWLTASATVKGSRAWRCCRFAIWPRSSPGFWPSSSGPPSGAAPSSCSPATAGSSRGECGNAQAHRHRR